MRLHLLHGPAITSSRAQLTSFKRKFDPNNVVVFDPSTSSGQVSLDSLQAMLMTPSLLSEEQLIILENPPEDFTFDSSNSSDSLTIILWFDYEIGDKKAIMEWVKSTKGEILFFPEGKEISVFPFLDYLAAGDKKAFLEMDKLQKAGYDIQYLITMTFYLLRNLAVIPKTVPHFVRDKLQRQRKRFDMEDIKNLYKATRYKTRSDIIANYYRGILEIDFKIKSGLIDSSQAKFLLVNKFLNEF